MLPLKMLLLAPLALATTTAPCLASATGPDLGHAVALRAPQCMAPAAFRDTMAVAGDWVIGQSPRHAPTHRIAGIVFRESGMIDVALFKDGCLAAVVVVGKAAPDLMV